MKYETLKGYSDEDFRRITGVKRVTFVKVFTCQIIKSVV